jgi:hypothetical protein
MAERFTVIDNPPKPPATTAQIAALEFAAIVEIAKLPKEKRIKNIHGLCDRVREVSVIAGEIVSQGKPELIQTVSARLDIFGPSLMELAEAGDAAMALVEIIRSAETRLAVVLAVVEGGDDEPPSGGGDRKS